MKARWSISYHSQLSGFLLDINSNPKGFDWFEGLHGTSWKGYEEHPTSTWSCDPTSCTPQGNLCFLGMQSLRPSTPIFGISRYSILKFSCDRPGQVMMLRYLWISGIGTSATHPPEKRSIDSTMSWILNAARIWTSAKCQALKAFEKNHGSADWATNPCGPTMRIGSCSLKMVQDVHQAR